MFYCVKATTNNNFFASVLLCIYRSYQLEAFHVFCPQSGAFPSRALWSVGFKAKWQSCISGSGKIPQPQGGAFAFCLQHNPESALRYQQFHHVRLTHSNSHNKDATWLTNSFWVTLSNAVCSNAEWMGMQIHGGKDNSLNILVVDIKGYNIHFELNTPVIYRYWSSQTRMPPDPFVHAANYFQY